jgi:hypothetical protein
MKLIQSWPFAKVAGHEIECEFHISTSGPDWSISYMLQPPTPLKPRGYHIHRLKIQKSQFLPTECIYAFRMITITNEQFYPQKKHQLLGS